MKLTNQTIRPATKRAPFSRMLMLICLLFISVVGTPVIASAHTDHARVEVMKARVAEIQQMDLKHMSATERKEIKKELKDMRKEIKAGPTYVYISGAGLLIIILILLLIL